MRFGAFVPQGWRLDLADVPRAVQWDHMVAIARTAEETGFDSVWVYDHFHTFPTVTQQPTWEAWTLMAGLAEATDRVGLGQMCTANSYRHPAYLAKVASCVDVMSGGRLDLGIGAGWYEHEYAGFGYPFPKASVRIGRLAEAVEIITAMWSDEPEVTFEGEHYTLAGAINQPKPVQDPRPPLWIAGGGEQLTLRVVAEHADYANFFGDPDTFRHKAAVLERHCEDVGRDPSEIVLTRNIDCIVGETASDAAEKLEHWASSNDRDPERFRENGLYGTPEQVVEQAAAWRDLGVGYLLVYLADAGRGDGLRLFGEQVAPELRSAA